MGKIQRRFERLLSEPTAKWDEVRTILGYYDFKIRPPTGGGSHWKVSHPRLPYTQSVAVHDNRIKKVYILKLVDMVEQVDEIEEG